MIHFTMQLKCRECGAIITFEDEPPKWREHTKEVRLAKDFIRTNDISYRGPDPIPRLVQQRWVHYGKESWFVEDARFINCLACNAEVTIRMAIK